MSALTLQLHEHAAQPTVLVSGSLTLLESEAALKDILHLIKHHQIALADLAEINNMDTSGAYVLMKTFAQAGIPMRGLPKRFQQLLNRVGEVLAEPERETAPADLGLLASIGEKAEQAVHNSVSFLAFFGRISTVTGKLLLRPKNFRWAQIIDVVDNAGVRAISIIALLNFLIGIVIAYQGGAQLKTYGANIFIVPLVAITILRELAPLITAIIVAGRTGASITARIGSMKVGEEIDAMQTLGMNPYEVLYIPRIIGLVIALPLLTLFADVTAIFGGMVVATFMLDVSFADFIARIPITVPASSLIVGLVKAPVFAATIALVACYQGQRVENSAESVGKHTTISVVQSIFLVILLDALFSILFNWLGVPILK